MGWVIALASRCPVSIICVMPIQFPLPVGTIVRCDYAMGGFRPPEMIKIRPAIIVSPRLPHRDGLVTVVPISTTEPRRELPYVVRLQFDQPLPSPFDSPIAWAKCDMLATVSFQRLEMFRTGRDHTGKRKYLRPRLASEQLDDVRRGVANALGL